MTQEGGLFLGVGKGDAELFLVFQVAHGSASSGLDEQLFDIGLGKGSARYLLNFFRFLIISKEMHGTHAVPASRLEQVKDPLAFCHESGGNTRRDRK
jgi:hypothetical protein